MFLPTNDEDDTTDRPDGLLAQAGGSQPTELNSTHCTLLCFTLHKFVKREPAAAAAAAEHRAEY